MSDQIWWFVARASGIVAWFLAAGSVAWGLLLSSRTLGRGAPAPWLLDLHRHLGGLTVLFTGLHMLALVADSYIHFGLVELLIPGTSSWQTGAVSLGVISFWLLMAVEISSLAMKRIPKKLWRTVHLTSYAVFVLATAHAIAAGTDMSNPLLAWTAVGGILLVIFPLTYRMVGPGKRSGKRPQPRAGSRERIPASARSAIETQ